MNRKKYKSDQPLNKKIRVTAYVEAKYLNGVNQYGDIVKLVKNSLELTHNYRHILNLREIYAKVEGNMRQLEAWKEHGPVGNEGEIDEYHLIMLELYRGVYFTIKGSKLLKMKGKKNCF
jgi:hypothetical protein